MCVVYSIVGCDPFRIAKYDAPTTACIGMEQVRNDKEHIAGGIQQLNSSNIGHNHMPPVNMLTPTWGHQVWTLRKYNDSQIPKPFCSSLAAHGFYSKPR